MNTPTTCKSLLGLIFGHKPLIITSEIAITTPPTTVNLESVKAASDAITSVTKTALESLEMTTNDSYITSEIDSISTQAINSISNILTPSDVQTIKQYQKCICKRCGVTLDVETKPNQFNLNK